MSRLSEAAQQDIERVLERLESGGHVTPELLAAYGDGELSRRGGELMIAHLAKCPCCAERALEPMGTDKPPPQPQPVRPVRPVRLVRPERMAFVTRFDTQTRLYFEKRTCYEAAWPASAEMPEDASLCS